MNKLNAEASRICGLMLAAVVAVITVPSLARTVSVSSFDKATGETVLAISAAESGDGDKALVAAWSATKISDDASDVRESAYVGIVSAAETTKSFTIPAAWLAKSGIIRFFLMASVPPYDARLVSIGSASAGPYIDTGFVPTTNSDIRVTAQYGNGVAPFGVLSKCNFFDSAPTTAGNTTWYYRFLGAGDTTSSITLSTSGGDKHEYWLNARGVFVDGCCKLAFNPAVVSEATDLTMTLFGRKRDASGNVDKMGNCTIFGSSISTNGVLVREYVPCRQNGEATLYDRQSRSFCAISGSGSFVAGNEIGPAPEDCGGVESATDPLVVAPVVVASILDRTTGALKVKLQGSHDAGVLYWVAGSSDAGTSLGGWQTTNFLCKVAADVQTVTTSLPPEWMTDGKRVRLIWRSAEDVPYDREVAWLRSSGVAWVDSGVLPTMQTGVDIRGKSAADVALFGLAQCFYLFANANDSFYGYFGGTSGKFAKFNTTEFHTLGLRPDGAYLDETLKVAFSGTTFIQPNFALSIFFRRINYSGSDDVAKNGDCTIQWAKISESGRVVRELVPCVVNDEACFYDKVSKTYLRSAASGSSFDSGETVASLTDADALAWSDVATSALGFVIVVR
ncbi:MAG: hypothetical protein K6G94_09610 [Kiritimatiellae bacterium]|nr:hypothetical protein [Kiritimatiellia bacterium]